MNNYKLDKLDKKAKSEIKLELLRFQLNNTPSKRKFKFFIQLIVYILIAFGLFLFTFEVFSANIPK